MYEHFFQFKSAPFAITPNTHFFCELKSHTDALNTLIYCINNGEGFVKVIGEVGTGKTLLCRKLLDCLGQNIVSAYIPNPDLTPQELRKAIAQELGVVHNQDDQYELFEKINNQLISYHKENKRIVLVIDEAQALSDANLETIRLLTNLETEDSKLLQVVLFGQPELDTRLNQTHLRQLKQRIIFSCYLPTLSRDDLEEYLMHRLVIAGHTKGNLFTKSAKALLYRASGGIPRLVNILSHKALLIAYGRGQDQIDRDAVSLAAHDTLGLNVAERYRIVPVMIGLVFTMLLVLLLLYI